MSQAGALLVAAVDRQRDAQFARLLLLDEFLQMPLAEQLAFQHTLRTLYLLEDLQMEDTPCNRAVIALAADNLMETLAGHAGGTAQAPP